MLFTGNSHKYGRKKAWFNACGVLDAKLLKSCCSAVSFICVAALSSFRYSVCFAMIISSGFILGTKASILKTNNPHTRYTTVKTSAAGHFIFATNIQANKAGNKARQIKLRSKKSKARHVTRYKIILAEK